MIETQAGLIEFKEAQLHRASVNEAFKRIEKAENERKYFAVRDWLSATNASLDQEAAEGIRSAYPETGKWILEAQSVKLWRKSDIPPRSKMWLYGKPGAGTSVITYVLHYETDPNLSNPRQDYISVRDHPRLPEGSSNYVRLLLLQERRSTEEYICVVGKEHSSSASQQ